MRQAVPAAIVGPLATQVEVNTTQRTARPRWQITGVRKETMDGVGRIVADVAGTPLWFESADAALDASPEAFATVMMLPALDQGATVSVEAALDPVWRTGTAALPAVYAQWWGYPDAYPIEHMGTATPGERVAAAGACFTGGVDSFHTLLTGGDRFDHLVFVHGFDIPLDDRVRMASFRESFHAVARRTGKRAIVLRTNLREHPTFNAVNWERTHGSAIAAAGQLLSPVIGKLIVPSSYRYIRLVPWGSHPDTDPLWSTSRMSIEHDDATFSRENKLRRMADDPLVWNNLRVCWENRAPTGNCSACHKCVRAMTGLAAMGRLPDFTVFDHSVSLAARLDALPPLPEHLLVPWENLLELDLDADTRGALDRLMERSRPGAPGGLVPRLFGRARRAAHRLRRPGG